VARKTLNSVFNPVLLATSLLLVVPFAHAEDRWVTDEFEVMMRSGKSTKQSIIRQLKTGTRVEMLTTDDESGYTKVLLGSGTEGWVLTRYLKRQPTAKLRLPELEGQLRKSNENTAQLRKDVAELKEERQQLRSQLQNLQTNSSSTQKQLDRITSLSSDTIKVDEQNRELKKRLVDSDRQVEELTAENDSLSNRADREWFLVGGAVLVAGLLLGLIIPRINWKKKSSWSDF
jgi:SH3 domain protein